MSQGIGASMRTMLISRDCYTTIEWQYIIGEARRWQAGRPSAGWMITSRARKWSSRGGIDLIIWPGMSDFLLSLPTSQAADVIVSAEISSVSYIDEMVTAGKH